MKRAWLAVDGGESGSARSGDIAGDGSYTLGLVEFVCGEVGEVNVADNGVVTELLGKAVGRTDLEGALGRRDFTALEAAAIIWLGAKMCIMYHTYV